MNESRGIEQVEVLVTRSEEIQQRMCSLEKELGAMEKIQINRGDGSFRNLLKLGEKLDALKLEIGAAMDELGAILGDNA